MSTNRTFELLDGEQAVYPGHPLTVAYVIMSVFPGPEEALAPSKHGHWSVCVGCADVPGAGDGANAGADVCQMLADGKAPEDAAKFADDTWLRMVNPEGSNHPSAWKPGQEQADKFRDRFLELAKVWGKDVDKGSRVG